MIYAFFDYDLFVVSEVQAFGAFELALKHRVNGHGGPMRGTLLNLVDRARKAAIVPPLALPGQALAVPVEALIALRNGLSHGTSDPTSPMDRTGSRPTSSSHSAKRPRAPNRV